MRKNSAIGKVLYGALFVVVLPAILVVWARWSAWAVRIPSIKSVPIGVTVAVCGFVILVVGMVTLMVHGEGLPMNAYPPAKFVARGIFGLVAHPIYIGFSILCFGVAVLTGSSSGQWLVTPVVILGCVALVQGFEKHDLHRRFGEVTKPLLSLPADDPRAPTLAERLSVYFVVLAPWLILYEAVRLIGIPPDARVAYLPFETRLPVYEWTEIIYASTYGFVLLAPLVAKSSRDLRSFSISAIVATGLVILLFVLVPFVAPPRPFSPEGALGRLLMFERANDTAAAAFPSFHVVWAFLAARVFAGRMPSLKVLWWGLAVLISLSCVTTGMHALADVLAGFVVFLLVSHARELWELLRNLTERIANSWTEWRLGPIRIINHGAYIGLATFVAFSLVGILVGPNYATAILIICGSALIGSAVFAQLVEGSSALLRPYGWYGAIIGAVVGSLIAGTLGANLSLLLAACSVGAPCGQAIGRLRCLVQGCCHGGRTRAEIGIRYTHPRSRVGRLAGFAGVPIHATPLYSILGNVVIAAVMLRLWILQAPLSLIAGVYLIMSGLARFIEEAYRAEPQTKILGGLRVYQWLAVATIGLGILATMIPTLPAPAPQPNWAALIAAAGAGLVAWIALGVDLPESDTRFARLT